MIQGAVNAHLEAVISIQVHGSSGQREEMEAAIDTGFDGFLTLPPEKVVALQLLFLETEEFTLGDGSDVVLDVHLGTVLWDGQERDVFVLAAEGGALVGMSLLDGYGLQIQVTIGGNVTIEALP